MDTPDSATAPAQQDRAPEAAVRARNLILLLVAALLLGASISLYANLSTVDSQYQDLARSVASTFFEALSTMRDWNLRHQGVYVPITADTAPNEYLADPLRDVIAADGLRLTKINHAQMTRMIAELLEPGHGVHAHITAMHPIRPQNSPDDWEQEALAAFTSGKSEAFALKTDRAGRTIFRYMAPLPTEASCFSCHRELSSGQSFRGGISLSFDYARFQALVNASHRLIWLLHAMGLGAALLPIGFLGRKLVRSVASLQASQLRVRQLEGLVPICASCKKIRTEGAASHEQASWVPVEHYIEERTDAEFTHGLCPDCMEKLYPEYHLRHRS